MKSVAASGTVCSGCSEKTAAPAAATGASAASAVAPLVWPTRRSRPSAGRRALAAASAISRVGNAEQRDLGLRGRPRRVVAAGGRRPRARRAAAAAAIEPPTRPRADDRQRRSRWSARRRCGRVGPVPVPASRYQTVHRPVVAGRRRASSRLTESRRGDITQQCRLVRARVTIDPCRSTSFAAARAESASRRSSTSAPTDRALPPLRRRGRGARALGAGGAVRARQARRARRGARRRATPSCGPKTKADFKAAPPGGARAR